MEDDEETIVINDLLSFLSCKYKTWPFERLLSDVKRFYPEDEIIQAYRTLRESIQETYELDDKLNSSDEALQAIHNCFLCVSKEHLPVFVCRDLENIPDLTFVKSEIPTHVQEEKQVLEKLLYENHMHMKGRIAHIVSTVNNLSDQLRLFATEVTSATGRQRINGGSAQDKNSHPHIVRNIQESRKSKPNLAYLQKLIDEDEKNTQVCRALDAEVVGEGNSTDEELTGAVIDTQKLRAHKKGSLGNNFNLKTVTLPKCQDEIFASKKRKHDDSVANRKVLHIKSESEDVAVTLIKNEVDRDDYVDELSSDMWMKGEGMHSDGLIEEETTIVNEKNVVHAESSPNIQLCDFVNLNSQELEKDLINTLFTCSLCCFSSMNKSVLDVHLQSHPGEEVFISRKEGYEPNANEILQCILCLEEFGSRALLNNHTKWCPAIVQKKPDFHGTERHTCQACGVFFGTQISLNSHRAYHDIVKPFECSVCGYRFYTQDNLDQHFQVHLRSRFQCPYCLHGCTSQFKLNKHIHIHTGYQPYECHLCCFQAQDSVSLNDHLMGHTDLNSYPCDVCGKFFESRKLLGIHKNEHPCKNLMICPKCGKTFKQVTRLKRHLLDKCPVRELPV